MKVTFGNRKTLETAQTPTNRGVSWSIRLFRGTPCSRKRNECACHIEVSSVKTAKHRTGCAVSVFWVEKAEMRACVPAAVFA